MQLRRLVLSKSYCLISPYHVSHRCVADKFLERQTSLTHYLETARCKATTATNCNVKFSRLSAPMHQRWHIKSGREEDAFCSHEWLLQRLYSAQQAVLLLWQGASVQGKGIGMVESITVTGCGVLSC